MYIYIFDRRFTTWSGKLDMAVNDPPGMERKSFIAFKDSSIPSIVTVVANLAGGPGSIDMLRLCAHGNAGYLQLGTGLTASTAVHFSALAPLFKENGAIEVHGCGVASNTNIYDDRWYSLSTCYPGTYKEGGIGHNFLKALASAAKVMVTGGVNCQTGDAQYRFEGPALTVMPGGESALS